MLDMVAAALCASASLQGVQLRRSNATVHSGSPAFHRHALYHSRKLTVCAAGPGGNVIDRPTVLPGVNKRRSTEHRKPPIYRVLLHNDNYNRREYVVRVLLKVVEGFTPEDAVNCMQEAHVNGLALVTMCAQETAERYVESLRMNGLISTLEPAGKGK